MGYEYLCWEDVQEGEALPAVEYELSLLRLVSFVRATGLYDYVHFDRDYARSVGARDAFISTPHVAGLFTRLLTDWSGPQADILAMSFSMLDQSCAGDMLKLTGRVARKYIDAGGGHLVDVVDMTMGHAIAPRAASAKATLRLPSRAAGRLASALREAPPAVPAPAADMPEFAKPLMRKPQVLQRKVRAISQEAIHLWCESLEDWNPLYWDEEFSARNRYGAVISPPEGNFFGVGSSASAGIGYAKPGEEIPPPVANGLAGLPLLQQMRSHLLAPHNTVHLPDFSEVVVVESQASYLQPVYAGDQLHFTQELIDCSPQKVTKLGVGHFFTSLQCSWNQRNEMVKAVTKKSYYYRPR